ncbi:hypothetical protein [Sulfurimonas sp. HSL3-7]|uniref:hypothetical protein n=1 Tax=Sulfonitrofixus jiaomeiensis TaxID=3131938 RepID=UPI0031F7F605
MRTLFLLFPLVLMSGCIHDISVAPELSKIIKERPVTIHRTVAYYIPSELYALQVTTPGGNNDELRYSPYKESEAALKKVLGNVFTEVHRIDSLDDPKIGEHRIRFIFVPQIETMSYSNSNVDWQPTKFSFILKVKFLTVDKKRFYESYAHGKGISNFGRYQDNPAYAVEIASRSAFLQLQDEIINQRTLFR